MLPQHMFQIKAKQVLAKSAPFYTIKYQSIITYFSVISVVGFYLDTTSRF